MKALFFLRHYNDIDHITPVIHKWVEAGHPCDVVLIGRRKFRRDYRIAYLRSLDGVRLAHVHELLPPLIYLKWRWRMILLGKSVRHLFIWPLVKALNHAQGPGRRLPLWRETARRLLERGFAGEGGGVVAFDWVERSAVIAQEWVETVISTAHAMGLGVVSLPHGDSPHANQLIRRGELQLGPDRTFSGARVFDAVAVPNELCAKRFRPFIDEGALAVLGSPRYCEEWLAKLPELLPPSPLAPAAGRLKVVMFLRKAEFTTFWEEVGLVVRMLSGFPDLELIIKLHTRTGRKQPLTRRRALRHLPNVRVVGDEVHSAHLLAWADVIIDLATSVAFEAVALNKPVLAADYLHAGRSTVAAYMPETELRCRDDVHEKITGFLSRGCASFYSEAGRQRFIGEVLQGGRGEDVLSRYVQLLESLAEKYAKSPDTGHLLYDGLTSPESMHDDETVQ